MPCWGKKWGDTVADRIPCCWPWLALHLRPVTVAPCCYMRRGVKLRHVFAAADGGDPWNTPRLVEMRQALLDGNDEFCHPGCSFLQKPPEAKHVIDGSTNEAGTETVRQALAAYERGDSVLEVGPAKLAVILGKACNNRCVFCRIPPHLEKRRGPPYEMPDCVADVVRRYAPGLATIALTGGEPLIYLRDTAYLQRLGLLRPGLQTKVMTNGILLLDRLDVLTALDSLYASVSLNAANAEHYRQLHRTDNFDRVVDGVRELLDAREGKPTRLSLNYLLTRTTLDTVPAFVELAISLGVHEISFGQLRVYVNCSVDPAEKVEPGTEEGDRFLRLLETARARLDERGIRNSWSGWNTKCDEAGLAKKEGRRCNSGKSTPSG